MKKIINNKVYDTETAKEVGYWGVRKNDRLSWCEETLYLKRTGEFFLLGEGGSMSRYSATEDGNTWSGSARIMPLSYNSARKWAEEKLSADDYEKIFGEVVEDDSRVTVTLSLSKSSIERAKRSAAQKEISLSAYIESLI